MMLRTFNPARSKSRVLGSVELDIELCGHWSPKQGGGVGVGSAPGSSVLPCPKAEIDTAQRSASARINFFIE